VVIAGNSIHPPGPCVGTRGRFDQRPDGRGGPACHLSAGHDRSEAERVHKAPVGGRVRATSAAANRPGCVSARQADIQGHQRTRTQGATDLRVLIDPFAAQSAFAESLEPLIQRVWQYYSSIS